MVLIDHQKIRTITIYAACSALDNSCSHKVTILCHDGPSNITSLPAYAIRYYFMQIANRITLEKGLEEKHFSKDLFKLAPSPKNVAPPQEKTSTCTIL